MPLHDLPDLPAQASVFLDANVLVYAVLGQSEQCLSLLRRIDMDIYAFCDVKVLHDCAHKLMLAEAGMSARKLKERPDDVKRLNKWKEQFRFLKALPVEWIALHTSDLDAVPLRTTQDGLLCGDSLVRVRMEQYGLRAIATNDKDFGRLNCDVYRPSDVEAGSPPRSQ